MIETKKPHEYWYYFGKCVPHPTQIPEGTFPKSPYERFDTKEECQEYIDNDPRIRNYKVWG